MQLVMPVSVPVCSATDADRDQRYVELRFPQDIFIHSLLLHVHNTSSLHQLLQKGVSRQERETLIAIASS